MRMSDEDAERAIETQDREMRIREAAPQLLEALEIMVAANEVLYGEKMRACRSLRGFVCDGMDLIPIMKAHDKARAAIKAAEGEG